MSAQGFYRFAAADTASDDVPAQGDLLRHGGRAAVGADRAAAGEGHRRCHGRALRRDLSWRSLRSTSSARCLFAFLDLPKPAPPAPGAATGRSRMELLRDPKIAVAIICGMVSYALMNLMMTSTPLAVVGCGFTTGNAADVVSAHVIAMFAPSFFTGHLIARFGAMRIVALGLFLLAARRGRGADRGGAVPVLRRADPAGHRLELRLHRRDGAADLRPMRPRNGAGCRG